MPFINEYVDYLRSEGVGTTNIMVSTKSVVPSGNGPFLTLLETGGMPGRLLHNDIVKPGYQQPSCQLVGTGTTYQIASAIIWRAYYASVKVRNQILGAKSFVVSSLVRASGVATVTTTQAHGFVEGMPVTISGALQAEYNGVKTILSTPTNVSFTFAVAGTPTTPASGTIGVAFLGTRYVSIKALQEPFDLGLDQSDRARVAFNVNAVKEPS